MYFNRSKSEVLSKFVKYVRRVEHETGLWVWAIWTDNEREYTSQNFKTFCADKGIMN